MKLLQDLGYDADKKASFGIYKCPKCHNSFTTRKGDVAQGKVSQCRACSEKPKCAQEDFSMPFIEAYAKPSADGLRNYTFVKLKCPICGDVHDYQAAGAKRNQYTECKDCRTKKHFTGTKTCTKCGVTKDITEYSSTGSTSSGKYSSCKSCRSIQSKKIREALSKEEKYAISAAANYNITKEEAIQIRENGTTCGICRKPLDWDQRHLDHCHTTGKIRGILCPTCNKGLGSFYDSVNNLTNAIKWLEKHNG